MEIASKRDTGSPNYRPSSFEPDFVNTATALADLNDGKGRRRLDEIFLEANEEIDAARLIEATVAAMMESAAGEVK
ncbi:hypothetical protein [Pararhizobium sp. DWP3-4]|uniref:hypothetical protein n=1 Tax=Pararhizobium sp. DWP3-4 TaxID=2804565 RepID=UPI003CEF3052